MGAYEIKKIILYLAVFMLILCGCSRVKDSTAPEYDGYAYKTVNGDKPQFETDEITADAYEQYSELDSMGRCGAAQACIGKELMPEAERERIGNVKPTGWQYTKYDNIDGKYLYNRCHLIAYQLTGENANEKNLITGTRYFNTEGMLPFENKVAGYIRRTGNHVMYRVTPVFEGDELVARGVKMEALSVEDKGSGICFNVFIYNRQPGVKINYADGTSVALPDDTVSGGAGGEADGLQAEAPEKTELPEETQTDADYILNKNTMRFHLPSCPSVLDISPKNRAGFSGDREALIKQGYKPCGVCKP